MNSTPANSPLCTAHVALGSNLGDRRAHLDGAIEALRRSEGVCVIAVSSYHETEPVGPPGQDPYLNAAAIIETGLTPLELMNLLLRIEREVGRVRQQDSVRWGARVIDLDLLLFDDRIIDEPGLTVPHPRMHERSFVLAPLAEIAPEARHAVHGKTVAELLSALLRKVT